MSLEIFRVLQQISNSLMLWCYIRYVILSFQNNGRSSNPDNLFSMNYSKYNDIFEIFIILIGIVKLSKYNQYFCIYDMNCAFNCLSINFNQRWKCFSFLCKNVTWEWKIYLEIQLLQFRCVGHFFCCYNLKVFMYVCLCLNFFCIHSYCLVFGHIVYDTSKQF